MTDPDQQPVTGQPPAPPAKKNRLGLVLAAVAVLLVIIGGTIATTLALQSDAPTTAAPAPKSAWEREQQGLAGEVLPDPTETATTPAESVTPAASDFTLTARVTDKKCYDSAGCNVEFKVDLAYNGPELSPDDTYEITYEVTGVEDGPMIGTLEVTGEEYTVNEELASTTSSKKKLVIKVTGVEKVGI